MDYDRRSVSWYWLLLFMMYCGFVIYLLFTGNPYLYSQTELRASVSKGGNLNLQTVPAESSGQSKVGAVTYFDRFNFSRSGIDPLGTPRSKNYEEFKTYPVALDLPEFDVTNISYDGSGFYLTGKGPWLVHVGLEGELKWKFRLKDLAQGQVLSKVLLDENLAYAIHPNGDIFALSKADGSIQWLSHIGKELVAEPFLWNHLLVVPVKGQTASEWFIIKRADGKLDGKPIVQEFKPGFKVSQGPLGKFLMVTIENKIFALNAENWKVDWSQVLPDPIRGPAVVVENQVYVTTLGSKLVKMDASKKGKIEWEAELEKVPETAPTYLPVAHRLSVMLDGGILAMVDGKTGKVDWTYNTLNKSPLVDAWSVRISAKHIEEYKMDWLHKGWTIWSACSNKHFCIFTPNKGQLISSISLSGSPLTLPLQLEKRWIFFGRGKEGQYVISHMLESSEIKKLQAESSKSAGGNR